MNGIFKTVLIIHILFGSVALFVAPAAMMTGKGRPLASPLGQGLLLGDHRRGDHGCRAVAHTVRVVFSAGRVVQLLPGIHRLSRSVSQNSAAARESRRLDRGLSDARRQRGTARLRCVFNADFELRDGRARLRSDRSSVRNPGHPRVPASPHGKDGVVVQPYDENAGRLHCRGDGVFRREFEISTASPALALADRRGNRRYRYLDEILPKEV